MSMVIEFDRVSKYFLIHHERSRSFQEAVIGIFNPRKRIARVNEKFWVLKDVSFQLAAGKTIGFIGGNGAGKSTLLKLIARIISPTSGQISTSGRIGALLELGAGFHPDLTGRENIYLNASILGLSRDEIKARLDRIIAFAELERFIDVPVKNYSSGMYVRLGFSVAVHTRPEVLLVDEVLAVGDAGFQRKCMDRISEMRREGVTIVLVSHGTETVQAMCDDVIWLHEGRVREQGNATDVIMSYLYEVSEKERAKRADAQPDEDAIVPERYRWGTGEIEILRVDFADGGGTPQTVFYTGDALDVRIHYRARKSIESPVFGLGFHHQNGAHISGPNTQVGGLTIPRVAAGAEGVVTYRIPALSLLEGTYRVSAAAVDKTMSQVYDYHDRLYPFSVYRGKHPEVYGLMTLNGTWDAEDAR